MSMGVFFGALHDWYSVHSDLINTSGLNGILALSIYVMLACGQLSLASPAYMAVGAYTAAMLTVNTGAPFALQLVAGSLLAAGVAFTLGLPLLRLRGVYLAISTVGFVSIVQIFFNTWSPGGGGDGISIPATTTTADIYVALAILCFIFWRLEGSAVGRSFKAIRQDEEAARSLGINTVAHKLAAFAVSGLVAGLAGVLYARLSFFIEPKNFDFDTGLNALVYVIVGGSLTFLGSPAGALLITMLPEFLRYLGTAGRAGAVPGLSNLLTLMHDYRNVMDGIILLAVILYLPGGLVDLPARLWRPVRLALARQRTEGAPAS